MQYLLTARDEHHIHSPFVFNLYLNVICQEALDGSFSKIESLRKKFLSDKSQIKVTDYGSGSLKNNNPFKPIYQIAKNSLKSKRFAKLLFRLVAFQKPEIAIELGTSLGITTLYQVSALPEESVFYTFEGCDEIAKLANQNFDANKNIKLIVGNIDFTLPPLIDKVGKLDYVFFDANHRLEPTIKYFELCKTKSHEQSLFIFDDIHRSKEMERAWEVIKKDEEVTVTVDLFYIGLVFFKKDQTRQHFVVKF